MTSYNEHLKQMDVRDKHEGFDRLIEEHRYCAHDPNICPKQLKLGKKITGLERRKREIRNSKRRSR